VLVAMTRKTTLQLGRSETFWAALVIITAATILPCTIVSRAQTRTRTVSEREYPKEIRGYKLERRTVEPLRSKTENSDSESNDDIITFGQARVVSVNPLGVTLEIPIVVAPVRQKGKVDFLSFYDMRINDTRVDIDDYNESFDLPTERPLTLHSPITVSVATPNAVVGALEEIASPKETWPVTGVVYVFGHFNKSLFKFKRVVPVELNLQMRNPLRTK
jgi:hypothetical protein